MFGYFDDRVLARFPARGLRPAPRSRERRASVRYLAEVGLLAALYFAAAQLGYAFEFSGAVAAILWLPVGVGIAYLALRGLGFWPGALVGDLLVNNYSTIAGGAIGQSTGNLIEVVLAAALIRRRMRKGPPLETVGGVAWMLGAIAAGTAASALIGPLSLFAANVLSLHALPDVMRTWWLGDACGALVIVPFALAWFAGPRPEIRRSRLPEAAAVLAAVALVSWLSMRSSSPLAYLVFVALILVAIRFGARGATLGIVVTAAFAIWATRHYHGPFAYHSITRAVLETQLFVAVTAMSTLFLAALVVERQASEEQLDIALGDAVRAGYVERHRLERNLHDGTQQRLLALLLDLSHARELAISREVRELLRNAEAEVDLVMHELREIARGMSPPILVERGLAGAIEDLALRSTVRVVTVQVPELRADVASEAAAYYVLAEAVANTQKHARASTIWLAASATPDGVQVAAVDDGVGTARESAGSGLAGLRERIESLGGTFDVVSLPVDGVVSELLDGVASPQHGTAVIAAIPVGGSTARRG